MACPVRLALYPEAELERLQVEESLRQHLLEMGILSFKVF